MSVPPPPPLLALLPAGTRLVAGAGYSTVLPDCDFETYSEAGYVWQGERWDCLPNASQSRKGLEDRVYRLKTERSSASTPEARTSHFLANIEVIETRSDAIDLQIEAQDRQGLLRDISELLSREKINVTAEAESEIETAFKLFLGQQEMNGEFERNVSFR